jgi:hypothetical protein
MTASISALSSGELGMYLIKSFQKEQSPTRSESRMIAKTSFILKLQMAASERGYRANGRRLEWLSQKKGSGRIPNLE